VTSAAGAGAASSGLQGGHACHGRGITSQIEAVLLAAAVAACPSRRQAIDRLLATGLSRIPVLVLAHAARWRAAAGVAVADDLAHARARHIRRRAVSVTGARGSTYGGSPGARASPPKATVVAATSGVVLRHTAAAEWRAAAPWWDSASIATATGPGRAARPPSATTRPPEPLIPPGPVAPPGPVLPPVPTTFEPPAPVTPPAPKVVPPVFVVPPVAPAFEPPVGVA
jgi:hypothetical protein